jgi:hypothetical protein
MPPRLLRRHARLGVLVALSALAACGDDDPVRPASGTLRIVTTTGGESQDADGYVVQIAGRPDVAVPSNGTTHVAGLSPGPVLLMLTGISSTCEANGGPAASATVVVRDTVTVPFTVACHAPPQAAVFPERP